VKKKLAAVTATVALGLSLFGCAEAPTPVVGVIEGKYIEDFTEPTIVMKADNGDVHHFTVEWSQYARVQQGQRFSSADLQQPADD
jgi:hypothetical protein